MRGTVNRVGISGLENTAGLVLGVLVAAAASAASLAPGDLVAVDSVFERVVRIDPSSGKQTLISEERGGYDVVVDGTGRIFATSGNDLVEVDSETGHATIFAADIVSNSEQLFGLALTPSGDLVVAPFSLAVRIVDRDTKAITLLPAATGIAAIAVDDSGDIYAATEVTRKVLRLSSTGALIDTFDLLGPPGSDFSRPNDISFAPDGTLIVTDRNSAYFVRLDVTTGAQTIIDPVTLNSFPFGLAVESSGTFVVSAYEGIGGASGLYRIDPTTGAPSLLTSAGYFSPGNGLRSVAVVPDSVPQPPPPPAPVECPASGSGIADPIVLCTRATGSNGPSFDTQVGFDPIAGIAIESQSSPGPEAGGSADVESLLGYAEVELAALKGGTSDGGEADVAARLHFTDTVTIDAPGFTGQMGRFRAAFLVSFAPTIQSSLGGGSSTVTDASYAIHVVTDDTAGWDYSRNVGVSVTQANGIEVLDGGDQRGSIVTGEHDFVFGTPFELEIEAVFRARAAADGADGTAATNLRAKVIWIGMLDIRRFVFGPTPPNPSLTSASGVDWRHAQAVPESEAAVALAVGSVLLARLARRRPRGPMAVSDGGA